MRLLSLFAYSSFRKPRYRHFELVSLLYLYLLKFE